jgi:hypothetical protein
VIKARWLEEVESPAFVNYLRNQFPDKIEPDPEDFDDNARSIEELSENYRLAQARVLYTSAVGQLTPRVISGPS